MSAVAARCAGSDLDRVRLSMAQHNLAVAGRSAVLAEADALRPVTMGHSRGRGPCAAG